MLLPIGHYLGARHRLETDDVVQEVRRGATFHSLTSQQLRIWAIAHGSSDAVNNNVAWQRRSVEESAGLTDAASFVDELIGMGLLAEVAPGTDQALEFAKTHQLTPLMLGLGNAVGDPAMFDIGFQGQSILQVNPTIYDLWHWSAMDDTLWATCQSAADVAGRSNPTAVEQTDPALLLTGLLESLHALLLHNAACLDINFRFGWPEAA